jgi:hypothetical protein
VAGHGHIPQHLWHRRRAKAREQAAVAQAAAAKEAVLDRLQWHRRRIDPARNMYRFYLFEIEPDLFGGFRLLRSLWRPQKNSFLLLGGAKGELIFVGRVP